MSTDNEGGVVTVFYPKESGNGHKPFRVDSHGRELSPFAYGVINERTKRKPQPAKRRKR